MRYSFWRRGKEARYALALVVLAAGAGAAQAQQKRLGFVVGMSEYGATAHPTALQDAGLVAQSLKSAGFEVQEAANLRQDEFRSAFRDFAQRAAEAGPDAVLAVYIAGVSLQDGGENILIPAGANLRQRTDLALEGLRLNDFIRALGSAPAKARLMMVDTAYTHPYGQLVAEGARGLAITDPMPGLAISYNQSPGLSAPMPQSNYGAYAMALAEALREPGLNVNAMFERVRLRVHDLSAGLQTPWDSVSVPADVVLNAPAAGSPLITSAIPEPEKPLAQVSVEDAYARALAQDSIRGYQDFLKAFPQAPQAKRVRALLAARREALFWQQTRRADNDRAYWTYLKRYPKGAHAADAENRLTRLSAPIMPPPSFDEMVYADVPPPPPEELTVYDEVVVDDGWHALPPPVAYPAYVPPPPVAIVDLEPPPPPSPWARALPAVGLGVGAAILANRMWRRPPPVRPAVAPPVPRPPRPTGGWVGRPPVVLPPGPPVPTNLAPIPARPGAFPPGAQPGAIGQPGARTLPHPNTLPQPVPGAIRPGQGPRPLPPNVAAPGMPGAPQPNLVQPPGARPGLPPPGMGTQPPGARPVPPVGPGGAQPHVQQPGPMIGGRPPLVRPNPNPAQGTTVGRPRGRMPRPEAGAPPTVRPMGRPAPQVNRPAPPMARPAPIQRAAPPMARPTPPMVRPAPVQRPQPMMRPSAPPPMARPAPVQRAAPPPMARPAPPPMVRPSAPPPRPSAPSCPPQLRAMGRC